jgi:protein MpaA
MERLGKNLNGYFGERIEIDAVLSDCKSAAREHGWTIEEIPALSKPNLIAFTRAARAPGSNGKHIYISAGIHGDEPAGPLAVRQLLQENQWADNLAVSMLPCLNPTGFPQNTRENSDGKDLNREYLEPHAEEVRAHIRWLTHQRAFDLTLVLHEDWESHGFYLYELNPDNLPSVSEPMLAAVSEVCPIDPSPLIEGRPAQNGLIRPGLDPRTRPLWPESFYLISYKTRLSYTLEAPSDFPLPGRVAALVTAVRAALNSL